MGVRLMYGLILMCASYISIFVGNSITIKIQPSTLISIYIYQFIDNSKSRPKLALHVPIGEGRKILPNFVQESQRDDKHQFFILFSQTTTLLEDIYIVSYSVIQLMNHPQLILVCDNCQRTLNHSASVLLIKTIQERRDLCFSCFLNTKGLESKWKYFVRPNLNVTGTESKWSILSDLKLLNGLEKYGYGNWPNVKNYLDYHASNFTEKEIQQHYNHFYRTDDLQPILNEFPLETDPPNPFTPPITEVIDLIPEKDEQNTDSIGFNPKRQEHLFDYDPEAENLVANLQFLPSDIPQEIELKYQLLEQYNKKVIERQKRQTFVNEHKHLSVEYNRRLMLESKVKRTVRERVNCFSRFLEFEEYQSTVNYLTLFEKMTGTIKQFMRHRRTLNSPTFDNLYQSMKTMQEERSQKFYRGAPQLKIHPFGQWQGKRTVGTQVRLTCEQAKKRLKKTEFFTEGMKVTDISSQS